VEGPAMPDRLRSEIERARRIADETIAEHRPVAVFAGFSGGHDSLVSTHFMMTTYPGSRALHIDTGIGIEGTREYVRRTCRDFGWPLVERRTPESYEDFVLAHGFPGPKQHPRMYQRLKERVVEALVRESKAGHPRAARVMFVTGIRGDESRVRSGYRRAVSRVWSQVWVNPFYHATHDAFRAYRDHFGLPLNPVVLKLGMSGECLCGAFAHPGELCRVRAACPRTADYIEGLEQRVRARGFPWGYEDPGPPRWWMDLRRGQGMLGDWFDTGDPREDEAMPESDRRPLCHNCEKVHR